MATRKLWAVLVACLLTISTVFPIIGFVLPGHALRVWGSLALYDLSYLGLLFLARYGKTTLSSVLLLVVTGAIMATSAWTAGGVRSPAMMGLLTLVGIAGILGGSLAAVLTTVVCTTVSFGLLLAERTGHLPPPSIQHNSVTVWFVLVCAMGELAVVQVIANWVIKRAEDQALASAKEHQKVEAAHRESEEKFAMVFQTSPDAIVISDLETGEIMEANPGYERLFGFSRAEIIGRTSIEIGVFDDSDDRLPMVAALRAGRGLRDWEMNARNRKGVMIPLLFSGDVMQLGDRTCLVAVIHDMTDRKAAEIREREVRDEFTRKLLLSQETERRRIAGELHDSLGQNLILLKNRAQLAQDAGGTPPQVRKQFEDLKDLVSQSIAEVRQISHDLRPHQLDQLGLTLALQAMIDGAAQSSRLKVDRKLDPVDDLFTPEDATHLYRAAQETFSNILKHSQARNARVSLERDVHSVRLWIEDDGQGFAASPSKSGLPTGGLGLSSIAERVRIIGGHLQIKSVPGTGTRVEITIPQAAET